MKAPSFLLLASLLLASCSKGGGNVNLLNYRVESVQNPGSISGTVRFHGAEPPADPIVAQRDQDVCGVTHRNPADPGHGPGIPNAIVYIEDIAAGKDFTDISAKGSLDQHQCEFVPQAQIVRPGARIVLSNSDHVIHNTHIFLNGKPEANEAQPVGAPPMEIELDDPGLNVVNCDVHPWMRAFVMVVNHPYYTMTDASGNFSLKDVPPGKYTVKVWRESWVLRQPKNANGTVEGYDWEGDYRTQQVVEVKPNGNSIVTFELH